MNGSGPSCFLWDFIPEYDIIRYEYLSNQFRSAFSAVYPHRFFATPAGGTVRKRKKSWCGVEQLSNDQNFGELSTLVRSQNQNLQPCRMLWRKLTLPQPPPVQQFITWKSMKEMWEFLLVCVFSIINWLCVSTNMLFCLLKSWRPQILWEPAFFSFSSFLVYNLTGFSYVFSPFL